MMTNLVPRVQSPRTRVRESGSSKLHASSLSMQAVYYHLSDLMRGTGMTEIWEMRLYVAGETDRTRNALDNLRNLCDIYLKDRCHIEVVDLRKHPEIAAKKEIFAIPTLVKELPLPVRKLIGDLHSTENVLVGLDISHREK